MKSPIEHNYVKKLEDLRARGEFPTGVYDVEVAHDDWCAIHAGGYCNCDPDIRIHALFPRPLPRPSDN
jgi:hypothetical protein